MFSHHFLLLFVHVRDLLLITHCTDLCVVVTYIWGTVVSLFFFNVLLTVHLGIILAVDQINAQILVL